MNAATLVVLAVVALVVVCAIFGCYKSIHSKSCCGGGKNCTCGQRKSCSIRKEEVKTTESEDSVKTASANTAKQ